MSPRCAARISEFVGVTWHCRWERWQVTIKDPDTQVTKWGGLFDDEVEAALRYNELALEFYGPLARLN